MLQLTASEKRMEELLVISVYLSSALAVQQPVCSYCGNNKKNGELLHVPWTRLVLPNFMCRFFAHSHTSSLQHPLCQSTKFLGLLLFSQVLRCENNLTSRVAEVYQNMEYDFQKNQCVGVWGRPGLYKGDSVAMGDFLFIWIHKSKLSYKELYIQVSHYWPCHKHHILTGLCPALGLDTALEIDLDVALEIDLDVAHEIDRDVALKIDLDVALEIDLDVATEVIRQINSMFPSKFCSFHLTKGAPVATSFNKHLKGCLILYTVCLLSRVHHPEGSNTSVTVESWEAQPFSDAVGCWEAQPFCHNGVLEVKPFSVTVGSRRASPFSVLVGSWRPSPFCCSGIMEAQLFSVKPQPLFCQWSLGGSVPFPIKFLASMINIRPTVVPQNSQDAHSLINSHWTSQVLYEVRYFL